MVELAENQTERPLQPDNSPKALEARQQFFAAMDQIDEKLLSGQTLNDLSEGEKKMLVGDFRNNDEYLKSRGFDEAAIRVLRDTFSTEIDEQGRTENLSSLNYSNGIRIEISDQGVMTASVPSIDNPEVSVRAGFYVIEGTGGFERDPKTNELKRKAEGGRELTEEEAFELTNANGIEAGKAKPADPEIVAAAREARELSGTLASVIPVENMGGVQVSSNYVEGARPEQDTGGPGATPA